MPNEPKFFGSFFQKRTPSFLASPAVFALAVTFAYLLAALPMLARQHFDISTFIVAGDRFVDPAHTPSPILVRHHSDGYDGQFYYRLSLAPLRPQATSYGVTLDHPAWRMQRILLPCLAWLVSAGQARDAPAALFGINLAGLFAIAWLSRGIANRYRCSTLWPLAVVAWPGLLMALTHDTTEILAASLLLGGIATWLGRRFATAATLLALATLARETSVLFILGILSASIFRILRPAHHRRPWREAVWAGAALLPFLAWRQYVTDLWRQSPQAHGVARLVGWPFLGVAQSGLAALTGHAVGLAHAPRDVAARVTLLVMVGLTAWLCVQCLRAAPRLAGRETIALACGWLAILSLMSLLSADGAWVDPTAYFRAFTEFWILGCVVLALTGQTPPRGAMLALLLLECHAWSLCWIQTKA